jgi:glycosyltransferase involved in cell wall biosynthesis
MPLVYRKCAFITVSESSKRDMQTLNITDKNIEVVHPGVDLGFLAPGQKSPVPLVAYVGRLKEYKSVDVLIKAFSKVLSEVSEAKLVIAGDGDDTKRLKRKVAELGLGSRVTFLGKVSEEKKLQILQEAWVCVNPSMMEGWGITVIEANACGTPVIASDVPGLRDSVYDRQSGMLVPYGHVNLLAAHITHILKDDILRGSLSKYAVTWAKNFEWGKSSEKFISAISRIPYEESVPGISIAQRI